MLSVTHHSHHKLESISAASYHINKRLMLVASYCNTFIYIVHPCGIHAQLGVLRHQEGTPVLYIAMYQFCRPMTKKMYYVCTYRLGLKWRPLPIPILALAYARARGARAAAVNENLTPSKYKWK